MVEEIITKVLQGMMGKELKELKSVLYCVLSGYEVSEKSTELRNVDSSWEEELGGVSCKETGRGEIRGDG